MPPLLGAHNLSSLPLSLDAMLLLNKGLRFTPTPQALTQDLLRARILQFKRRVRLRCQFGDGGPAMPAYRLPNPGFQPRLAPPVVERYLNTVQSSLFRRLAALLRAQPVGIGMVGGRLQGGSRAQHAAARPTQNLTRGEQAALRELRSRRDLIIKPADKNLGLTVMDAPALHAASDAILGCPRTYSRLPDAASTQAFCAHTYSDLQRKVWEKWSHKFGFKTCEWLTAPPATGGFKPAAFYLLPKLHKMPSLSPSAPIKGRPIAAGHSWITKNLSVYLGDLLNAALVNYPTVLRDRDQLLRQLDTLRVHPDAWFLTFDVESLYPNVEHAGCVEACSRAVPPHLCNLVKDLLGFLLSTYLVSARGETYQQIYGGPMGTNCMPPAAQIYLAEMWEGVLQQQLRGTCTPFPSFYRRYIDDGLVIFDGSEFELLEFLSRLETLLPNIKITYTYSQVSAEFLDLVLYKGAPGLDGKAPVLVHTHQKPLNKYLYIPYDSFHSPGMFKGFIRAELIRYVLTNSEECWFDALKQMFFFRLRRRGYPAALLERVGAAVQHSQRGAYLFNPRPAGSDRAAPVLSIPFARLIPELRPQELLAQAYFEGGAALHAALPSRPFIALQKVQNLGSLLVKASH